MHSTKDKNKVERFLNRKKEDSEETILSNNTTHHIRELQKILLKGTESVIKLKDKAEI